MRKRIGREIRTPAALVLTASIGIQSTTRWPGLFETGCQGNRVVRGFVTATISTPLGSSTITLVDMTC